MAIIHSQEVNSDMNYTLLLFFVLLFQSATGQEKKIERLDGSKLSVSQVDSIVKTLMDAANVQGLDLAILNNKKVVFIKAYGSKNKTKKELLDTSSVMYGASLSKAVFGYLTMKLAEENILELDKPLYQYLSKPITEYEYFKDLQSDDRWKLITARMCLSHTSGLPNTRWVHPTTGIEDTLGVMKIYFQPGTKYAYSGEGFKLLQLVQEEITQKTLEQLAQEKIFQPLGMTRTGYIWHPHFDDNFAIGHFENDALNPKKKRTTGVAGGSMVTTIADYARFIENVVQQKGLSKKQYKEMLSKQISIYSKTQFPPITYEVTDEYKALDLSYGLGWGLLNSKYGKAFFKGGWDDAWRNYNINFIDKGISIIIMTNSANGSSIFKELLENLIGDVFTPWKWQGYQPYTQKDQ